MFLYCCNTLYITFKCTKINQPHVKENENLEEDQIKIKSQRKKREKKK